jgi:hypothetical protein
MSEISMHEYGRVTLGTIGMLDRLPEELLDASGVALALLVPDHGQREHAGIALEHFGSGVIRPVVQNKELVLAGESSEYLANFPEKKPDGRGFVVTRYTDVNHVPSREWAQER